MKIPIFQVDAFAERPFSGNPAAVCPLDQWLDDGLMQAIAAENNLSETAFLVAHGDGYALRWFTPLAEVDLCGHATLAAAFVVFEHLRPELDAVVFETRSGRLAVARDAEGLRMDFPSLPPTPCATPPDIANALGGSPQELLHGGGKLLAIFEDEDAVRALRPDPGRVARLPYQGVIVSAPGRSADFVSRYFAPAVGVPEDPVTGSAHCVLMPYWAARLGRARLNALQVSRREGRLNCELLGDRVSLGGQAVLFLRGEIVL